MMLPTLSAQISSLFAASRPVAPAYCNKPVPPPPGGGSRHGSALQHNTFVPTITHTNYNILDATHLENSSLLGSPIPATDDSGVQDLDAGDIHDHEAFDKVLHDLAQMEHLWDHSLYSADDGSSPPVCDCHSMLKGSCPVFKADFVDQITN